MLTFEKIRDIERAEREAKQLQRLPEQFFDELRDYIHKKGNAKDKTSIDVLELENVRNTIKRFLEARERKLVELALSTARGGLPPDNLTALEERYFTRIAGLLKAFRGEFFDEIGREPAQKAEKKTVFRVKKTLPAFVGPDMKTYELREGDVIELPKTLNDLLLKEGIIERTEV
ncbi:MAG: DNA replication complex GINS family protein [Candidatus Aenigmarchaeota archaeon]|nr:DNA replication complex GINS family protein [Candidatus Aenigmarchaeota archaeon]